MVKQSDDITDLEHSLELLRREYNESYLIDVPNKLTQIHQHLQNTADLVAEQKPDDELLFETLQSWATKVGVNIWYKPKKDKINRLFMKLQMFTLLSQFKKVFTPLNDQMMISLDKLANEMDDKGIGLSSKLANSYVDMQTELDSTLQGLGSLDVSKTIQKYLLYSYGLNSVLLFAKYSFPEGLKWLPMKYRTTEASLKQNVNNHVKNLRAEVVKQIQLYLLGRG